MGRALSEFLQAEAEVEAQPRGEERRGVRREDIFVRQAGGWDWGTKDCSESCGKSRQVIKKGKWVS